MSRVYFQVIGLPTIYKLKINADSTLKHLFRYIPTHRHEPAGVPPQFVYLPPLEGGTEGIVLDPDQTPTDYGMVPGEAYAHTVEVRFGAAKATGHRRSPPRNRALSSPSRDDSDGDDANVARHHHKRSEKGAAGRMISPSRSPRSDALIGIPAPATRPPIPAGYHHQQDTNSGASPAAVQTLPGSSLAEVVGDYVRRSADRGEQKEANETGRYADSPSRRTRTPDAPSTVSQLRQNTTPQRQRQQRTHHHRDPLEDDDDECAAVEHQSIAASRKKKKGLTSPAKEEDGLAEELSMLQQENSTLRDAVEGERQDHEQTLLELKDAQETINSLSEENDQLTARNQALGQEVREAEEWAKSAQQRSGGGGSITAALAERQMNKKLEQARLNTEALTQELDALKARYDVLYVKHEGTVNELEATRQKVVSTGVREREIEQQVRAEQTESRMSEVQTLREELMAVEDDYGVKLRQAEQEINERDETIKKLQGQLHAVEEATLDTEGTLDSTKGEVAKLHGKIHALEKENEGLSDQNIGLINDSALASQNVIKTQSELRNANSKISELLSELERAQRDQQSASPSRHPTAPVPSAHSDVPSGHSGEEWREMESENMKLYSSVKALEGDKAQLEVELRELEVELQRLIDERGAATGTGATPSPTGEAADTEVSELRMKVRAKDGALRKEAQAREALEAELRHVDKLLRQKEEENASLVQQLNGVVREKRDLEDCLVETNHALSAVRSSTGNDSTSSNNTVGRAQHHTGPGTPPARGAQSSSQLMTATGTPAATGRGDVDAGALSTSSAASNPFPWTKKPQPQEQQQQQPARNQTPPPGRTGPLNQLAPSSNNVLSRQGATGTGGNTTPIKVRNVMVVPSAGSTSIGGAAGTPPPGTAVGGPAPPSSGVATPTHSSRSVSARSTSSVNHTGAVSEADSSLPQPAMPALTPRQQRRQLPVESTLLHGGPR